MPSLARVRAQSKLPNAQVLMLARSLCCSVPQDVLESHLSAEPGTPVEELGAVHEDNRVLVPKRVALQVGAAAGTRTEH